MKTLEQLKAENLPRLDWRTIFDVTKPLSQVEMVQMDAYFRKFVQAPEAGICIRCGSRQGGNVLSVFLGEARFQWGMTHGEGFCSKKGCGYPARALHYDVGPIAAVNLILQYHPDELTTQVDATLGHEDDAPDLDPSERDGEVG